MEFTISCEKYLKLAAVCSFFDPATVQETRDLLKCVRLENKNGKYYAIATNQKIAAIYYLGLTESKDGSAHIVVNDLVTGQCEKEAPFGSVLHIISLPEIALGSLKTTLGYEYNGNACLYSEKNPLEKWREWFPDKTPSMSRGRLYMELDHIGILTSSSPTGKIIFPEHVDVDKPVILNDYYNESWVGLFMPKPEPHKRQIKHSAGLPSWLT